MMEAGVVVDIDGQPIYWHVPDGRSGGQLPDSAALWDVMWAAHKAGNLGGFAHSHPGNGWPAPSDTDTTTFHAIETGLGRPVSWWICSADKVVLIQRIEIVATSNVSAVSDPLQRHFMLTRLLFESEEPGWLGELRRRSDYAVSTVSSNS